MGTTTPETAQDAAKPPVAPTVATTTTAGTPMLDYVMLTKQDQQAIIKTRLKDLEDQHLKLTVQSRAPSTVGAVSESQTRQLTVLTNSIVYLKGMLVTVGSRAD